MFSCKFVRIAFFLEAIYKDILRRKPLKLVISVSFLMWRLNLLQYNLNMRFCELWLLCVLSFIFKMHEFTSKFRSSSLWIITRLITVKRTSKAYSYRKWLLPQAMLWTSCTATPLRSTYFEWSLFLDYFLFFLFWHIAKNYLKHKFQVH